MIQQHCTETFVAFDDATVAEFFDDQVDLGRPPRRVRPDRDPYPSRRLPQPSFTDHETFEWVFSSCDWAVMAILARSGATHAEMHWKAGGPTWIPLRVKVDFSVPFTGSDHAAWNQEYAAKVHPESWPLVPHSYPESAPGSAPDLDVEYADLFADFWPGNDFQESTR